MKPNMNPNLVPDQAARLVPLDRIDPDPDQPRKNFPEAPLRELADHIWFQGLIQPITASTTDDGRFKIFTGERRWRAFMINQERAVKFWASNPEDVPEDHPAQRYERWTTIPLLEAPPLLPADRLLLQVGENHDRSDLTLYERAAALYRSFQLSGLKNKEFAEKAGISPSVLSTYKGLATSSGLTKLALESGVLQDQLAAKIYMQLPYDRQEFLLVRAQEEEALLTRIQLQRELDAIEAAKELAKKAAATPDSETTADTDADAETPKQATDPKPPVAEANQMNPDAPVLSVEALLWLQNMVEGFNTTEDEPLRFQSHEALTTAVLRSSPFILIREIPAALLASTAPSEEVTAA